MATAACIQKSVGSRTNVFHSLPAKTSNCVKAVVTGLVRFRFGPGPAADVGVLGDGGGTWDVEDALLKDGEGVRRGLSESDDPSA